MKKLFIFLILMVSLFTHTLKEIPQHILEHPSFKEASKGKHFFNQKHLSLFTEPVLEAVKNKLIKDAKKSKETAETIVNIIRTRRKKEELLNTDKTSEEISRQLSTFDIEIRNLKQKLQQDV